MPWGLGVLGSWGLGVLGLWGTDWSVGIRLPYSLINRIPDGGV